MSLFNKLFQALLSPFYSLKKPMSHTIDDRHDAIQNGTYVWPAEWDSHTATILGFPSRCSLPRNQYDSFCLELIQLAVTIAEFEPVRMHVRPGDMERARSLVPTDTKSQITLIPSPINHPWVRDTGPIYVRSLTGNPHQRFAINFGFNEWGGKEPENDGVCWGQSWPLMDESTLQENNRWARWVINHDHEPAPVICIDAPICAEGGGLVHDGEGTLLISESCIVCDVRNPGMAKADIEKQLKRLLGIEKVIWFPGRKNIDITDEHMDASARFIRPGVVVYSKPHDMAPAVWHELSTETHEILHRETDAKGRRLQVHVLEEPGPSDIGTSPDEEPAVSYVNFYFVNGGLVIPQFGDEERDLKALELLQHLLPGRVVRQVPVNAIPLTGGVLHCITQQVPAIH